MRLNLRGRAIGVLSASALAIGGLATMAGSASAVTLNCGDTVTSSVTLSNDIGPCTGNGLVIGASGVTLNLGGHTITGSATTNTTANEQVGILVPSLRNVTVTNGTVQNFDAGVAIQKGKKNIVSQMTVRDNINHSSRTGTNNRCNFGDGIVVTGSDENVIKYNVAYHNGPYDGIAVVGNSDNNIISANRVYNQNVANVNAAFVSPGNPEGLGPCGPFGANGPGVGRPDQDIGIRIEGPGADNNQVVGNTVTDNMLDGITIHGYVCLVAFGGVSGPGLPPVGQPNTNNLIEANNVRRNGFDRDEMGNPVGTARQDGIAILSQGPLGTITCGSNNNTIVGNTSIGNARHGIYVTRTGDNSIPASNTINQNTVRNNGTDGINLQGPNTVCPPGQGNSTPPNFCNVPRQPRNGSNNNTLISNKGTGNGEHDGHDSNPNCDQNYWKQNIFGTVNQPCVKANGGTGTVTGPIP